MAERRNFGRPGHFIAADSCRFHLHTHVAGYCVSTVGDYWPPFPYPPGRTEPEQIGLDRLYETMVFPLGDNDEPSDWEGVDFGAYNSANDADAGHEAMVRKYEGKGDGTPV